MVSEIFELMSIREQISNLSARESELVKPKLSDLSLIPYLHNYFIDAFGMGNTRKLGAIQRKKFVFIIVLLYSPSTLAGGCLNRGVRDGLAHALKLNAPSAVSRICPDLIFSYQHYRDFRLDVDNKIALMEGKLRSDGYL